jgi:hypothetical protein
LKHINTLIKDVYNVAEKDSWFPPADTERYCTELGHRLLERLTSEERPVGLRLSQMGDICPRSLWASVHSPSVRERFPAHAKIKFHFGDVVEAMAIALAKAAGHTVTGEQDELELLGVKGHRDCVIDGCIVDVKSINSMGFQKVKSKQVSEDIFLRSYLDQLDGYLLASADDPVVTEKDTAYLWCIDKAMGHMCLYEHRLRENHIRERITSYKEIVARSQPPACTCGVVAEGASGNLKLDLKASYNPWKYFCYPNVRTFIYAGGKPTHLVKVVRKPDVLEVDRNGSIVI